MLIPSIEKTQLNLTSFKTVVSRVSPETIKMMVDFQQKYCSGGDCLGISWWKDHPQRLGMSHD